MERSEQAGLGVALAGHMVLFAALSLGLMMTKPSVPNTPAMEVQIVDEIALKAIAPKAEPTPSAPSAAPEVGPPEEQSAPPEHETIAAPEPKPRPAQMKSPPPAASTPLPHSVAAKAKPIATKPTPVASSLRPQRGSRLGADFLKGLSDRSSPKVTPATPAPAAVTPQQVASLGAAILRMVQPCADRIRSPGPGAERIITRLSLSMNRDGSFAADPMVISQTTDADNGRYANRVGELAKSAFVQCSPFRLPPELYSGWRAIVLKYHLPD